MGAGLSAIVLAMIILSYLYRRELNMKVMIGLIKGSVALLLISLMIKVVDFSVHRKWNFVFGPDVTWESVFFWIEITLQVFLPVIILAIPAARNRVIGLVIGASSAALGLIARLLNTGIIGYFRTAGIIICSQYE